MISPNNAAFLRRRRTYVELLWKAIFNPQYGKMIATMSQYIRPGTAVIDIGANVGYYARAFARKAEGGPVLAFEPQTAPRAILTTASFFTRNRNILVFPFALGERAGLFELKIPIKTAQKVGVGLAHIGDMDDLKERFEVQCELVACQRLDDVMDGLDVGRVSLIKIDVEGGELGVLKGAQETLAAHRPKVICELGDYVKRFGIRPEAVLDFFAGCDYVPCQLATGEPLAPGETEHNMLFCPREAV